MSCPAKPDKPTKVKPEHLQKGCVFWFDLEDNVDPTISSTKARLYVIISRFSHNSSRIILSPITDRLHCVEANTNQLKYPNNAPINKVDNPFLDKDSVVLLDQVYTIAKCELCEEWFAGQIQNISEIDNAIMYNYDLFETIYNTYKKLFEQLNKQFEDQHKRKYSRK